MKQIVLMYHDVFIRDMSESGFQTVGAIPYKVCANNFESHVKTIYKYCKDRGFDTSSIVFTFDDGGVSFATVIPDILEKYGFKGVFFISTKYIGTTGFLTERQIKDLSVRGHVIGSHSHTHPAFCDAAKMSFEELRYEWQTSIDILNNILGYKINSVSLPNGYSSEFILDSLEELGISNVYTSTPTTHIMKRSSLSIIGRYDVQNRTTLNQVMSIVNSPIVRVGYQLKNDVLLMAKKVLGNSYYRIKRNLLNKE